MRASGERSSWLALASSDWCERTSASTRAGGDVEARRDRGDLVVAADVDPVIQLAGAELLDAPLQRLEPPRQPPHHREGARGDRDEQDHQHHDQAEARAATPAAGTAAAAARRPGPPVGAACGRGPRRRPQAAGPHDPQRATVLEADGQPARRPSAWRRRNDSDAAMRSPRRCRARAAGAAAATSRAARRPGPRPASSCPGSERWISSAHAAMRSVSTESARRALLLHVALEHPARAGREQQQHHHDGG